MAKNEKDKKQWKINIRIPCKKRGIENAYQLWKVIGGSKQTTACLFRGETQMIRLDTIQTLHDKLNILPVEIFTCEEIK